jgi:hypothetical protein
MPEPNSNAAAGLAAAYVGVKLIGLDVDYLIVGAVGALFSRSRMDAKPFDSLGRNIFVARAAQMGGVAFHVGAISFFAASSTAVGVHLYPSLAAISVPIAGLVGYFGGEIVRAVSTFINRAWRVAIRKIGGNDGDLS